MCQSLKRLPGKRGGFTLIELLVVISIVVLLISILLPALKNARRAAVNIKCQSNIRSLGMAFQYYLADYKEGFVPAVGYFVTGGNPDFNWYSNLATKTTGRGGGLGMYIPILNESYGTNNAWYCPDDPYLSAPNRRYTPAQTRTTYMYNFSLQSQLNTAWGLTGYRLKDGNPRLSGYGWNHLYDR